MSRLSSKFCEVRYEQHSSICQVRLVRMGKVSLYALVGRPMSPRGQCRPEANVAFTLGGQCRPWLGRSVLTPNYHVRLSSDPGSCLVDPFHSSAQDHADGKLDRVQSINLGNIRENFIFSEYSPLDYRKHLNTKLFEVQILNGAVFQWQRIQIGGLCACFLCSRLTI